MMNKMRNTITFSIVLTMLLASLASISMTDVSAENSGNPFENLSNGLPESLKIDQNPRLEYIFLITNKDTFSARK